MYKIEIEPRIFHFKQPAGTSRGVYTERKSWLLTLTSDSMPGRKGVGECAPLPDLSCDATPEYEKTLNAVCERFCQEGVINYQMLRPYPSILFGLETALLNLERGDILFDTPFSRGEEGININGLVWMGSYEEMLARIEDKLEQGFHCVKLKIGAIDFDLELEMVKKIRDRFSRREIELRVDADGAYKYGTPLAIRHPLHRATHQAPPMGIYGTVVSRLTIAHCPRRGTHRSEYARYEGASAEYHQTIIYRHQTLAAWRNEGRARVGGDCPRQGHRIVDYQCAGE